MESIADKIIEAHRERAELLAQVKKIDAEIKELTPIAAEMVRENGAPIITDAGTLMLKPGNRSVDTAWLAEDMPELFKLASRPAVTVGRLEAAAMIVTMNDEGATDELVEKYAPHGAERLVYKP